MADTINTKVCFCGCGGSTKGRFVPGHDAKLHSTVKQVLRGKKDADEELARLPHDEARAEFLAFSDRQQPKEEARERKLAAQKAAKLAKAAADKAAEETAEDEEEEATEVVAESEPRETAPAREEQLVS